MSCTPSVVVNTRLAIEVAQALVCLSALNDGYCDLADVTFSIEAGNVYTLTSAAGNFATSGFAIDDQIVIKTTDGTNDGTYTVLTVAAGVMTVEEPVVADTPQASCKIYSEEVFKITPTRRMGQTCIAVYNITGQGDMTFSLAPGAFWAAGVALTGVVADGDGYTLLFVETAKYLQADGTMLLTLAPAAGKKLTTNHTAEVCFVELP